MYIIRDFEDTRYQLELNGKLSYGDLVLIPSKTMNGFVEVTIKIVKDAIEKHASKYPYEVVRFVCTNHI